MNRDFEGPQQIAVIGQVLEQRVDIVCTIFLVRFI